jgi:hypothetical protein
MVGEVLASEASAQIDPQAPAYHRQVEPVAPVGDDLLRALQGSKQGDLADIGLNDLHQFIRRAEDAYHCYFAAE